MAVIHCGADMFVRPAYLPQVWKHRIAIFDASGQQKKAPSNHEWDIVGPLCFTGDIIAHQRRLPDIESGDLVVIYDSGAYTLAMWSRYNSRQVPRSHSLLSYSLSNQFQPPSHISSSSRHQ